MRRPILVNPHFSWRPMTTPRSIVIPCSLLLALFLALLLGKGLFALSEKGNADHNHALIIGISKYGTWDSLKSPSGDAARISKILLEKYDFKKENVVVLTDESKEKPDRVSILTYLDKYVNELTEKDNLLIFFSGNSKEDEKGETYWIPRDGKETTKMTWLKHSDLCREFFANPNFKAKNVLIITDSAFRPQLVRRTTIALSPRDLRYPQKIREKSENSSRMVIAFGDVHWRGTKRTQGIGLFSYYLSKALEENWDKVIDFENLLFTTDTITEIKKIAGTQMLRGRLKKAPMEKDGQWVITRLITPPKVNVLEAHVSPRKGYQGDKFIVEARTNTSAFEVYLEVDGREYPMEGDKDGTSWKFTAKIASLGPVPYKVVAINADDVEGMPRRGTVTTLKRAAGLVNVASAEVKPKRGWSGNQYRFEAVTDSPSKKVQLIIGKNRYDMEGSATKWALKRAVEDVGTLDYQIVAFNEDNAEGRPKGGILVVKASLVDVVAVKASPGKGFAGEEFLITAKTDRPAASVSLDLDGVTYPMTGSGVDWTLKRRVNKIGKLKVSVIASNVEGARGGPGAAAILTEKKPLALANVTAVDVSPKKPFTDETVAFNVRTNNPADEVYVEIEGKKYPMEGRGTQWKYETRIASVGKNSFKVFAVNSEGKQGSARSGAILTRKRPLPIADIAAVAVSPRKPLTDETFAIRVKTTAPAKEVLVEIAGKRHSMKGSGTEWEYMASIPKVGKKTFSVIAMNPDGKKGKARADAVTIAKRAAKAVDVVTAGVSPGKGLTGEQFAFNATTSREAKSVALVINEKRYAMTGSGTKWSLKRKIDEFGTLSYQVVAKNEDGAEGGSKIGSIVINAPPVNVVEAKSAPGKGYAGDEFLITARTDNPAKSVALTLDGVTYKMKGSGTKWSLKRKIPDIGTKKFTVLATNLEGMVGTSGAGNILTEKRPVVIPDVAAVDVSVVSPGKGFAGDSFLIEAKTTTPSEEVFVEIEGRRFAMQGSGTQWKYQAKIDRVGPSKYTVIAMSREGEKGKTRSGEILTKKKPLLVPDVAAVDVSVVSPGKGYAGDTFLFQVTTSTPSTEVFVEIEDKQYAMEGVGTEWKYFAAVDKLGKSPYRVIARNKEGKEGLAKEGAITTKRPPKALVNVAKADVNPKKGFAGGKFSFAATTDRPATGVTLVIGKDRYRMTGSGTSWALDTKLKKPGDFVFYMVATNEEGVEGGSKTSELVVAELTERYKVNRDGTITDAITGDVKDRFKDNGDGTVTDLATNLMWLRSPKQIALTYDDAVKYCNELKYEGHEGWRLPTVGEWRKLMDKTRKNPALPPGHPFVNIPTQTGYWSKTRHKFGPLYVYQVTLWYGKSGHLSKKKYGMVWPVRYAEASK
jgi:ribosomal protein L3